LCKVVRTLIQSGVPHEIGRRSMELQSSVIEKAAILDANEVRDLYWIHRARSMAR
jgi:hypothetical protein